MVPVLDENKNPLSPCREKRARILMSRGCAKAFWQNGIFCIILTRKPKNNYIEKVIIGIDPGSKRTGITVATEKYVVANQLFTAPDWIKKAVDCRKMLRRSRRQRKTPYRKCRRNRSIGGLSPSTRARWGAHLRIIDFWKKLVPLFFVSIEDINANTKKNCKRWNKNFSPLQIGKLWFEKEVEKRGYTFYIFHGYETKRQRDYRGFIKSSNKLKESWNAHNIDSHCLCELAFGNIKPYLKISVCEFFRWHRRQIHVLNPKKGNIRKEYGTTRSFNLNRGTLIAHNKYGLTYVGGRMHDRISLHNIESGERLARNIKKEDCKIKKNLRWRTRKPI
jgi:hypothetical protein